MADIAILLFSSTAVTGEHVNGAILLHVASVFDDHLAPVARGWRRLGLM